jgi:hypothetical protein
MASRLRQTQITIANLKPVYVVVASEIDIFKQEALLIQDLCDA